MSAAGDDLAGDDLAGDDLAGDDLAGDDLAGDDPAGGRDPAGGWPFAFACRRSGNCCAQPGGMVRVDAERIAAMAAHLGMSERGFRSRYVAPSGRHLVDGLGGRCVFLDDGPRAGCRVYPVRPQRCRSWPLWPELRDDEALRAEAARLCPGITPRPPGGAAGEDR